MNYSGTASDLKGVSAIFSPQKSLYMKFYIKKTFLLIVLYMTVEFPPNIILHWFVSLTQTEIIIRSK